MSPAEQTADPGEPGHEGIVSPPSGSREPAAGWRPREPPLITVDPAFVLDRWRPGDEVALRRFDLDPATARFFGCTVEQAQAMPGSHYDGAERARGSLRAWQEGRELNLAIRRRSDGEAAGWVELRLAGDEAEVSYNVTAELRGHGIASRALQAFLTWAGQQTGLRRAHLACHIDNLASRRVAEKCGFVLLGRQGEEYQFRRDLTPAERRASMADLQRTETRAQHGDGHIVHRLPHTLPPAGSAERGPEHLPRIDAVSTLLRIGQLGDRNRVVTGTRRSGTSKVGDLAAPLICGESPVPPLSSCGLSSRTTSARSMPVAGSPITSPGGEALKFEISSSAT